MNIRLKNHHIVLGLIIITLLCGFSLQSSAKTSKSNEDLIVVIDPGHGGKDHGAIDNNAKEKEINLAVAKRLGELIKKKLKHTDVVFTRDDDTFVSLQGRADIANKSKGNLFISIHTNSVDAKNKNRSTVAGASVYTLGNHKDEANMGIARRENSVIELENGYQQKYSGFDPNKDESYIIFEMAQKQNVAQSNRFAKMVQDNLVKIAGRKDRGVHQAGFWVLWSTCMPSILVELDFICNPESAKFMTSQEGVDKLADAIFEAVKVYEQNFMQSKRMAENSLHCNSADDAKSVLDADNSRVLLANASSQSQESVIGSDESGDTQTELPAGTIVGLAFRPAETERDLSHSQIAATRNQKRARTTTDGRRRRSQKAKEISESRNVEGTISLLREYTGKTERVTETRMAVKNEPASDTKDKKNKKKGDKKIESKKVAQQQTSNKKTAAGVINSGASEIAMKQSPKKTAPSKAKRNNNSAVSTGSEVISGEQHAAGRKSLRSKTRKD